VVRVSIHALAEVEAMMESANVDEALVLAERIVGSHPSSVRAWSALSEVHAAAGESWIDLINRIPDGSEALIELRVRLSRRPVSALGEVRSLVAQDQLADAIGLAQLVVASNPSSVTAWRTLFELSTDPVAHAEQAGDNPAAIQAIRSEVREAIRQVNIDRIIELIAANAVLEFPDRTIIRRAQRVMLRSSIEASRRLIERLLLVDVTATQHLNEAV